VIGENGIIITQPVSGTSTIYSENSGDFSDDAVSFQLKFHSTPSGRLHGTYHLPSPGYIKIGIFNVNGRKIYEIAEGFRLSGLHEFNEDLSHIQNGFYIIKLRTGMTVQIKKIIIQNLIH